MWCMLEQKGTKGNEGEKEAKDTGTTYLHVTVNDALDSLLV